MRFRHSFASLCLGGAVLVVAACTTDYQLGKGDPQYGNSNALDGLRPPGPTVDTLDDAGGSSAVGSQPKCVTAGGTQVDAGACAVSFSKDVLGAFGIAGCSSTSCHGGVTPRNEPRVEESDGPLMWQEFQAFTLSNGKPYINPCSIAEADSTIGCNLVEEIGPTACGVHMPSGAQMPQADIDKINAWVKCGSPNN